ncbi:hypothetical protein J1N35_030644 [Gossypium stocksii]|uniref:Uncharacterized protein n=1 Tax=Gossypium stocksii TaxID=47602 RepID=A0A9D3V061_9ROSI|nr:hypothetical protein J1N35_030644 [Gossypium stocksii]
MIFANVFLKVASIASLIEFSTTPILFLLKPCCRGALEIVKYQESDYVIRFLKGLAKTHSLEEAEENPPHRADEPQICAAFRQLQKSPWKWLTKPTPPRSFEDIGFRLVNLIVWRSTNKAWNWAFDACRIAVLVSIVALSMGKSLYHNNVPVGSPLLRVIQVFVVAIRNRKLPQLGMGDELHEVVGLHNEILPITDQFR